MNKITQAKKIMMAALREHGFACCCGEPRYRGRPCVECRMCAFVADEPATFMATARLVDVLDPPKK